MCYIQVVHQTLQIFMSFMGSHQKTTHLLIYFTLFVDILYWYIFINEQCTVFFGHPNSSIFKACYSVLI